MCNFESSIPYSGSILNALSAGSLSRYYHGLCKDMQNELGQILRTLRRNSALTQKALAKEVYCSASTLSAIENGNVFSNMEIVYCLCQYYNEFLSKLIWHAHIKNLCLYYKEQWERYLLSKE